MFEFIITNFKTNFKHIKTKAKTIVLWSDIPDNKIRTDLHMRLIDFVNYKNIPKCIC